MFQDASPETTLHTRLDDAYHLSAQPYHPRVTRPDQHSTPDPRLPGGGLYEDAHARNPTWPATDSRHSAQLFC